MIFESPDGAFDCVVAVDAAGRSELEVDFFMAEELLQWFRLYGGARAILDRFGQDAVVVVVS
jgi:hypothetical protein